MKILNVTIAVFTDANGETVEKQVSDPNFQVGQSYEIDELGPGYWAVTEVGDSSTTYTGKNSVVTTRVKVTPEAVDPSAPIAAKTKSAHGSGRDPRFSPSPFAKPVARPTQKTRHTPK